MLVCDDGKAMSLMDSMGCRGVVDDRTSYSPGCRCRRSTTDASGLVHGLAHLSATRIGAAADCRHWELLKNHCRRKYSDGHTERWRAHRYTRCMTAVDKGARKCRSGGGGRHRQLADSLGPQSASWHSSRLSSYYVQVLRPPIPPILSLEKRLPGICTQVHNPICHVIALAPTPNPLMRLSLIGQQKPIRCCNEYRATMEMRRHILGSRCRLQAIQRSSKELQGADGNIPYTHAWLTSRAAHQLFHYRCVLRSLTAP
jgi:hypothetical protein